MPNRRPRHLRLPVLAVLVAVACLGAADDVRAQGAARAMGMGGAFTAAARGLDAVAWNPANLVIRDDGGFELGLASLAVDVNNNSFTLQRYNEVSGAVLTQADKQMLLDDIPIEGLILDADVRASVLGFRSGSFALTFEGLGGGSGTLDKDFFDLILMGNEIGQSFRFDDTDGEAYAAAAATASWAVPLVTRRTHRLALGVNARYLHGLYDFRVESATGGIQADLDGVHGEAEASYLSATGGRGWAVDAGLALQAPRGWTFGLAVVNAGSRLTWDRETERSIWTAAADSVTAATDDLDAAVVDSDTSYAVGSYGTTLPTVVRFGASNRLGRLLYAVDVARAMEERPGVSKSTEVSVGFELQAASWFRPRIGLSSGGATGRRAAAGLGLALGPLAWDLAVSNHGEWVPDDSKGLAFASGFGLRF